MVMDFKLKSKVDYSEIFSLFVKVTTIRLVLGIVVAKDLHIEKLYTYEEMFFCACIPS